MRFSGMAEALEELLRDPNSDLIPFRLKYPHADLDETIYDPERLLDTRIIEEYCPTYHLRGLSFFICLLSFIYVCVIIYK